MSLPQVTWKPSGFGKYTKVESPNSVVGTTESKPVELPVGTTESKSEQTCYNVGDLIHTKVYTVSTEFDVPVRITRIKNPNKTVDGECQSYYGKIEVESIEDETQRKYVEEFFDYVKIPKSVIVQHNEITEVMSRGGKKTKRKGRSRKNKRRPKSNKKQRKSRR